MKGYYQDGITLKCYKEKAPEVGKYQKEENLVDCPKGCNDDKTGCRFNVTKGDKALACLGKCIMFFKDWSATDNTQCEGCVTNASLKAPDNKLCECTAKKW